MTRLPPASSLLLLFAAATLLLSGCGRTLLLGDDPLDGSTDTILPPECDSPADCDDGLFCNGVEACLFGACVPAMGEVCDDGNPCTVDFCDERLRTCFVEANVDMDGDGFASSACGGSDCDDTRRDVFPGNSEICDDGVDNDCNFAVDCADGACVFAPFCMCVPRPEDCFNGIDDDCDGFLDCSDSDCFGFPECDCRPEMERCDNGLDDDCNGLIDCEDPICGMFPGCLCAPFPESCNNMFDDDCDGLVDCADPDCDADPACCVPRPEICTNMIDDDCDGFVDCDDMLCAATPACRTCPEGDLGSRVGDRVAIGSTVGRSNNQTASCAGGASSPDFTYSWRAPTSGRFTIDTIGSDYDTALHVRSGTCSGPEIACDDDSGVGTQSLVQVTLVAGQAIVIIVDGWAGGSSGNYVLNINRSVSETGNCGDGLDNDRDGLVDCEDPDCAFDALCMRPCPEEDLLSAVGPAVATGTTVGAGADLTGTCAPSFAPEVAFSWTAPRTARYRFDTIGSSFDTVLYLLDGSCTGPQLACDNDAAAPASRITRNVTGGSRLVVVVDGFRFSQGNYRLNIAAFEGAFCSDGIDNDLDGNTDCADSECSPRPECCVPVPEICNDMVDQDCDGLIDCADPNCAGSPSCCTPRPEDCANGRDDDCDGLIDCVDPSCAASPVC